MAKMPNTIEVTITADTTQLELALLRAENAVLRLRIAQLESDLRDARTSNAKTDVD
jgi:hypothetical protein